MITIRQESSEDILGIRLLNQSAFSRNNEADLVDTLRAHEKLVISFIAEDQGKVIGHIAFSPITTEPEPHECRILGLGPLAVLPERQRRGIGTMLVTASLNRAKELGYTHVILLGGNYYHRFGFQSAPQFGITSRYNAGNHLMIRSLEEMQMPTNFTVKYEPEFDESDC